MPLAIYYLSVKSHIFIFFKVSICIYLYIEVGLNIKNIEALNKYFKDEKNSVCNTTLKKLVLDHLYMYDVTYDKKQSICKKLDININEAKSKMISLNK